MSEWKSEYQHEYYLKNRDELIEDMKAYNEENKEWLKIYRRNYYREYNRRPEVIEKRKALKKAYYERTKEARRAYQREWLKRQKEKTSTDEIQETSNLPNQEG